MDPKFELDPRFELEHEMRSTIFLALQDCVTYTSHFVWHDDVPLVLVCLKMDPKFELDPRF